MRFRTRIDFTRQYFGIWFGAPGYVVFETTSFAFVHVSGRSCYSQSEGPGYSPSDNLVVDKVRAPMLFRSIFNGRLSQDIVKLHAQEIARLMHRSEEEIKAAAIKAAAVRWTKTVTL